MIGIAELEEFLELQRERLLNAGFQYVVELDDSPPGSGRETDSCLHRWGCSHSRSSHGRPNHLVLATVGQLLALPRCWHCERRTDVS